MTDTLADKSGMPEQREALPGRDSPMQVPDFIM